MRKARSLRRMFAVYLVLAIACAATAWALLSDPVWPEASGAKELSDGALVVDASHAESGYIMARAEKSDKRLKLRVEKDGVTLTYDLNTDGEYEVFPLQLGSGSYKWSLFKNVTGKKYAQSGAVTVSAELSTEDAAFLVPSQYVNYTPDTEAVRIAAELCQGLDSDRDKFEAIRDYIRKNYVYDFVRATTVASATGVLPDIDGCVEKRMGICQDLAAMAACMLRTQGVPTKLVVGYANNSYHAWNSVTLGGEEILYDPTAELNALVQNAAYTVERFY